MASDELRKKWGTIFMGEREASVEQLNAMQEHLHRDRRQKDEEEDYMERVRKRAADRARQILGAAYTERQKVLDEARGEAAMQKKQAEQECARIKAEGESLRKMAQAELARAQTEREEAEKIRQGAREEGLQQGIDQAAAELHEFRADLGQSLAALLRAIERQRKSILENWREDLVELTRCAAQSGSGFLLQKEHEAILRSMVMQALDHLENRSAISIRVNPSDEESVSDMFRAARERAPELKQWTVTGDDQIEPGGLVAESGTGSVDLRRSNFRDLVDGILCHLALPESQTEAAHEQEVRTLVEQEVAHIASLTPEPDLPADEMEEGAGSSEAPEPAGEEEPVESRRVEPDQPGSDAVSREEGAVEPSEPAEQPEETSSGEGQFMAPPHIHNDSLAELEDELFADMDNGSQKEDEKRGPAPDMDEKTLSEGGFL